MPLNQTSGNATADSFGGGVAAIPNYIEDVFSTYLIKPSADYTTYSINNGIDLSTKGGMTWFKARDAAQNNLVYDTARGSSSGSPNALITNGTQEQQTAYFDYVTPNTNGFTVNYLSGGGQLTNSGINYASWTFRKQPKFFDVVTYTGTGVGGRTVAHSLGSTPGCIIVKASSGTSHWSVYHRSIGNTGAVRLNLTGATDTSIYYWNNTDPTSTEFSVANETNSSGVTYVAYLFAHDAGGFGLTGTDNVISCASFVGTGSDVAVNLGYEPQWLLVKRASSGTDNWRLYDNMRGMFVNFDDNVLFPNLSNAESQGLGNVRPTATGFDVAGSFAASGVTYIYIAIRRGPMKVPTDATKVFSVNAQTGAGTTAGQTLTTSFPVDLEISEGRSTNGGAYFLDKLRGGQNYITSATTAAEVNFTGYTPLISFANNTGILDANYGSTSNAYVAWNLRRAPSFFDEVCYTGASIYAADTTPVNHNLGVVPELVICKSRNDGTRGWGVWASNGNVAASSTGLSLNTTAAALYPSSDFTPYMTATTFTPGLVYNASNQTSYFNTWTYVAYLFATCPGVSKVGSYTGTGTLTTIDCGFTGGARFVMIKRTDSADNWYVWDTARGMVSGTDASIALNSSSAESNANSIYTITTGFQLLASPARNINGAGNSYIYLAIA